MLEKFVQELFIFDITPIQIYLLWFLLGSFTVATLSDLKHLSAQREFLHVWILFVIAAFSVDFYHGYFLNEGIKFYLFLKWFLILIFFPLYFHYFCHIAWGDIFAKMAACSLFPPLLVIVFIILIRLTDFFTGFLWRRLGRGNLYPFMPVVFLVTLVLTIVFVFLAKSL